MAPSCYHKACATPSKRQEQISALWAGLRLVSSGNDTVQLTKETIELSFAPGLGAVYEVKDLVGTRMIIDSATDLKQKKASE
jgi:hypothetical protein